MSWAGGDERSGDELVETLLRWQDAGGVWRVAQRRAGHATVALLTCAGGEEVERLEGGEPAWLDFLAGREDSEDDPG